MAAGEFDRNFDFMRSTTTYDSYNKPTKVSWSVSFTLWVRIMEEGGREFISAQKTNSETTMLIKIRNTGKIRKDMRVAYAGKTYDILHISEPKDKRTVRYISLKEVV